MGIIGEILGNHPLVDMGSVMTYIHPNGPTAILKEGLIHTYPIDDVIKVMSRIFDLKNVNKDEMRNIYWQIKTNTLNNQCNGYICKNPLNSEVLTFIVGNGGYNKGVLDSYLNKYGYFLSNETSWDKEWVRYQYEKKFDTDITDLVKRHKYIYHICPDYLKTKILKQGITPHIGKFKGYNNDYRCYFFIEDLGTIGFSQWANDFRFQNDIETDTYLLIKIDVDKISQDIKFYVDPRMENGTYTLQGISPDAFDEITEIHF